MVCLWSHKETIGCVTRSFPTNDVGGGGTRDAPLRMSAGEATIRMDVGQNQVKRLLRLGPLVEALYFENCLALILKFKQEPIIIFVSKC